MVSKPQIPRTSYLDEGKIPSKWVVSVLVVHPDASPCKRNGNWSPSADLSLSDTWQIAENGWDELDSKSQEIFHDVVNVLNDCWGYEGIEGATKTLSLVELLAALKAVCPDDRNQCRTSFVIVLLEKHRVCADTVRLEMGWGW